MVAAAALAGSCSTTPGINEPRVSSIKGLASPVMLHSGSNLVYLNDYIAPDASIDSADLAEGECTLDRVNRTLSIQQAPRSRRFVKELRVWSNGACYSLPCLLKDEQTLDISIPDKGYKTLQVKGEFNGWNATPLKFSAGTWSYQIVAPRGTYQYCLVANGKEMLDPGNPDRVSNNMGGFNSLARLGDPNGKTPLMITQSFNDESVVISVENGASEVFVFWENYRLPPELITQSLSGIRVAIPRSAQAHARSHLRVWSYNSFGVGNDLLIPLREGKVLDNPATLKRDDMQAQVLYSIMIDRFCNGNTGNDYRLNSPEVLPKADYFGGDLAGVTQKIKSGFFESLGVTTIWLSPIFENPYDAWGQFVDPSTKFSGYHGYWPLYLTKLDPRFGTEEELHELLSEAHRRNLNVILDYVAHHVHINSPLLAQHPDWITPLHLPDGSLNLERWDDQRLTTWFDKHLPTLDLSRPEIAQAVSDSVVFIMKKFAFDGLRYDASKHVDTPFWRMLTQKLKTEIDRPLYQIGETYGSPELIASYVNSGLLNAQFDFNLYDAAVAAFSAQSDLRHLSSVLQQSLSTYGSHNLMGNITGNHDRVRFISFASGDVRFNEDGKRAGWKRNITVSNRVGYSKLALLHAFVFSIPGVPCIYYGDEFGMPGANDPDNRRQMQFGSYQPEEQALLGKVKKLAALRHELLPLSYGDTKVLYSDLHTMVVARCYFGQIVVAAFNAGSEARTLQVRLPEGYDRVQLQGNFGGIFSKNNDELSITLNANSFDLLNN